MGVHRIHAHLVYAEKCGLTDFPAQASTKNKSQWKMSEDLTHVYVEISTVMLLSLSPPEIHSL